MNTHPTKEAPQASSEFVFNDQLNAKFLKDSYGENLEFGKKMFSIFLSTIEEDIEILTNCLERNDYLGMKDIAHKIKNNFTWVGLPKMSNVMYKIEMAAKDKSVSVINHYNKLMDLFSQDHMLVQKEYERMGKFLTE